jgi:hypothetical protein
MVNQDLHDIKTIDRGINLINLVIPDSKDLKAIDPTMAHLLENIVHIVLTLNDLTIKVVTIDFSVLKVTDLITRVDKVVKVDSSAHKATDLHTKAAKVDFNAHKAIDLHTKVVKVDSNAHKATDLHTKVAKVDSNVRKVIDHRIRDTVLKVDTLHLKHAHLSEKKVCQFLI